MSSHQFDIKGEEHYGFPISSIKLVNNCKTTDLNIVFFFLLKPTKAWSIINHLASLCVNLGSNSTLLILTLLC